jgi:hypothetical protein
MSEEFKILDGFLQHFGEEVEGRESPELSDELKTQLGKLARGEVPAAEQAKLFLLLKNNPGALAWLASQIKELRAGAA